jgi:hypothetical protein
MDGNPGTHDWTVPVPNGNKKSCLVKVVLYDSSDKQVGADTSDDPFNIEVVELTYPNGGQTLTPGATETITWATYSTIRSEEVIFHKDGRPDSYWIFVQT